MLTSRQRSRVRTYETSSLLTISTVADWFICALSDAQLRSLYVGSCQVSLALRNSVDAGTPETQQFLKEEELKQQLISGVALRRGISLIFAG